MLNLNELSTEELQSLLDQKRQLEKDAKAQYEAKRDAVIDNLVKDALALHQLMCEMKTKLFSQLQDFKLDVLEPYTGAPSSPNLTLTDAKQKLKVQFQTHRANGLDERADQAAEHLRRFLANMVTEENKVAFDLINSLLEKKGGEYDARLITRLFPYENEYSDPDWVAAIKLFKESIQKGDSTEYIRMYHRSEVTEKWQPIVLDFAALPMQK